MSQAIAVSVLLDALYLIFFNDLVFKGLAVFGDKDESVKLADPAAVGAVVLVFGILIPALLAALYYRHFIGWRKPFGSLFGLSLLSWIKLPYSKLGYSRVPSSWDFAAPTRANKWVRVKKLDGSWIGGWFTGGSFVSGYPEPRDIFINEQWHLGTDGAFGAVIPNTAGVWVSIEDGDIVEWIN